MQIILVLDTYFIKKKYISRIKIEEKLINNNLDNWSNFCIFGKINNKNVSLSINKDLISFDYDNIKYKIKVQNYNFTSGNINIDDCITIYKKNNNIKLTLSIDDCILYLDVIESQMTLLKEDVEYFLISNKIQFNEDNFIFVDKKEDVHKDNSNLVLVRYNNTIPNIFKYKEDFIVITKHNLWKDFQINKWILYEDLLIYNSSLINLQDCIKYYPTINENTINYT